MQAASKSVILALVLCLLGALGASAADITASGVSWQAKKAPAVLTISGPAGVTTLKFGPGETPFLPVDGLADGLHTWELVYSAPARNRGLDADGIRGEIQNGYFTVLDGLFLDPTVPEAADKQLIAQDLYVQGSICAGGDCVNNAPFGFDTLRLQENNLRIKFQDTSNNPFPTNDWQLTANDSTNGGANKFSIDDIDAGNTPFTIEAGAGSNALYVDDSGRVGLGTSTPVVELHIVDGDSPTVRLEQNGSSGFGLQTWDIAGNETNFFVRDVTNGSLLPFRIRPRAPGDSIFVDTDGDVGLGTSSPDANLEVSGDAPKMQLENTAANGDNWFLQSETVTGGLFMSKVGSGGEEVRILSRNDADGSDTMTVVGSVTATAFNPVSTRDLKAGFARVDPHDVLNRLAQLDIQTWHYKIDDASVQHMGPIAEDFAAAFGLGKSDKTISTTDSDGVALAAIQALLERVEALETQNQKLLELLVEKP